MIKNKYGLIIQKVIGMVMIILSVLFVKAGWFYEESIQNNDCTAFLIIIPMAIYMIFTKENYIRNIN